MEMGSHNQHLDTGMENEVTIQLEEVDFRNASAIQTTLVGRVLIEC